MDVLQLGISPQEFLARYWQRKPLLIRGGFRDFEPPIDSDTLAGLALEEDIESRIIEFAAGRWQLHHGPFAVEDFRRDTPWTLLVQAVDHYLPEVEALRRSVGFIPQWRMDDVMVSYAVDGGSVGPHYDNYDVFLVQGEGRRRWRIGQTCGPQSGLLPHEELRILEHFEQTEEYLLEPGDVLYVPPRVAHWGIAEGECTTFSIGFRAPRVNELVCRLSDSVLESLDDQVFFTDPGRPVAACTGEISLQDLQLARQAVQRALDDSSDDRWFGELVTEPRYEMHRENWREDRDDLLAGRCAAVLAGGAKLAWLPDDRQLTVFANGESVPSPLQHLALLRELSDNGIIEASRLAELARDEDAVELLDFLLEVGCIHAERDDF
ncbi:JmjC domain-containing protein [Haliea sp. E17]|uniref:JmjC domain-containing protein n=1 Tax=Haliea sp. E17 TaxID=3401576 RepID=UPI003AAB3056